jgi:hypothetical protein
VVILLAVVVGLVVGVLAHSAVLGVVTSGGVVAIFALIHAYLFGMKVLG